MWGDDMAHHARVDAEVTRLRALLAADPVMAEQKRALDEARKQATAWKALAAAREASLQERLEKAARRPARGYTSVLFTAEDLAWLGPRWPPQWAGWR